jgi:hypothetical protein
MFKMSIPVYSEISHDRNSIPTHSSVPLSTIALMGAWSIPVSDKEKSPPDRVECFAGRDDYPLVIEKESVALLSSRILFQVPLRRDQCCSKLTSDKTPLREHLYTAETIRLTISSSIRVDLSAS